HRRRMLSLLSPWRDANELWLFAGLGLFLAAFPKAAGNMMGPLYLPLCLLGLGVLLRSAAFEIQLRAPRALQQRWLIGFGLGSLLTAFAHGLLLAQVVVSYYSLSGYGLFTVFMGVCAVAAYGFLGSSCLRSEVRRV